MQRKIELLTPYHLPSENTNSLSTKVSFNKLKQNNEIFEYNTSSDDADFIKHLHKNINAPLHYTSYLFRRVNSNQVMTNYFRVKNETLQCLDGFFNISVEYTFLDYDFGKKGEKEKWSSNINDVADTIKNHPLLSKAIWYPTVHGIRFIFKANPVKITLQTSTENRCLTAGDYSNCYRDFVETITRTNTLPFGSFDTGSPAHPFALERHPRCIKEDGTVLHNTPIYVPQSFDNIDLLQFYKQSTKDNISSGKKFEIYFDNDEERDFFYSRALAALYDDPLFKEARERNLTLPYEAWRSLGTNICAITKDNPDSGFDLFKQFSSWDKKKFARTNLNELKTYWSGIINSRESGYGACTYGHILESSEGVFTPNSKINTLSSPAGRAWKIATIDYMQTYDKQVATSPKQLATINHAKSNNLVNLENTLSSSYTNSAQQVMNQPIDVSAKPVNSKPKKSTKSNQQAGAAPVNHNQNLNSALQSYQATSQSLIPEVIDPSVKTADDVKSMLRFTIKGSGENAKPEFIKDLVNLETIFTHDSNYKDKFRRNILGFKNEFDGKEIVDEFYTRVRTDITRFYGIQFPKEDIQDKIKELCSRNVYNPIYDYLISVPKWDNYDRVGELLEALGIKRSHHDYQVYYTYLRKWIISCVSRPLQWLKDDGDPSLNDKIDTLLVLKGGQGRGKSTFFKEMCPTPTLFSDSLQSIEHNEKDASIHLLNYWMIEFGEFDGLVKKSSIETLKSFITRRSERFRPPYRQTEITARRPSVLVGTTNSDQFLNDPTGARRFWTIELEDSFKIDLDYIKKNRDMIWSQAIALFLAGEQWWLEDVEQVKSDVVNDKFKRQDPWSEYVERWVATGDAKLGEKHGFTLTQLFDALQLKVGSLTAGDLGRMKKILKELGYVELREWVNYANSNESKRLRVWRLADDNTKKETEQKPKVEEMNQVTNQYGSNWVAAVNSNW
jgi:predicted P-loop ATPase